MLDDLRSLLDRLTLPDGVPPSLVAALALLLPGLLLIIILRNDPARHAFLAALCFGILAFFASTQDWHLSAADWIDGRPVSTTAKGHAALFALPAAMTPLFAAVALALALGRGEGGFIFLGAATLVTIGGILAQFSVIPNPSLPWNAPIPRIQDLGSVLTILGILGSLLSFLVITFEAYQQQPAPVSKASAPRRTTTALPQRPSPPVPIRNTLSRTGKPISPSLASAMGHLQSRARKARRHRKARSSQRRSARRAGI